VTTKLGAALREKFGDPKKLLEALGLDESVLDARKTERHMATKPTRLAYAVLMNTARAVNPLLALDAKVDYAPIVAGLTTKNFKARKPEIVKQLGAALKGKLAIDEGVTMGHVGKMLDHIEKEGMTKPESLDASVSPEQHNAMEAAAHGHSNLGIPKDVGSEFAEKDKGKTFDAGGMENLKGFLKSKGVSDEDIATGCDMMFKKTVGDAEAGKEDLDQEKKDAAAVGDETPEEKEAKEKKEAEDKAAKDAKDAADKAARDNMVTKDEMNKSISAAVNAARLSDRQTFAALEEVRPYVGELKGMTFDSAEKVYSHALKTLGVKVDGVHPSAFKTILDLQPKPGAKPVRQQAHDSAPGAEAVSDFNTMYPGAAHIQAG
jgi:hypothetical protein